MHAVKQTSRGDADSPHDAQVVLVMPQVLRQVLGLEPYAAQAR
jgi:hypothetical protein